MFKVSGQIINKQKHVNDPVSPLYINDEQIQIELNLETLELDNALSLLAILLL